MKDCVRTLELASRGALPDAINDESDPPFEVVRELVEAGHLKAVDVSSLDGNEYMNVRITASGREYLGKVNEQSERQYSELFAQLDQLRDILVSVSTGGERIESANPKFKAILREVDAHLRRIGRVNPIPFRDLWDWRGRWSRGDLPTWQERRDFVAGIFRPLLDELSGNVQVAMNRLEPTGWSRVDRAISEIRRQFAAASTEEQFQALGLLCREALISAAQSVFDPARHPPIDGTTPSDTDAKRMFDAFIAAEIGGGSNEAARKHARAAFDLANVLQHRRTATFREAAMCVEATGSVVSVIAIISGRRDP